jgi:hypothetical protein
MANLVTRIENRLRPYARGRGHVSLAVDMTTSDIDFTVDAAVLGLTVHIPPRYVQGVAGDELGAALFDMLPWVRFVSITLLVPEPHPTRPRSAANTIVGIATAAIRILPAIDELALRADMPDDAWRAVFAAVARHNNVAQLTVNNVLHGSATMLSSVAAMLGPASTMHTLSVTMYPNHFDAAALRPLSDALADNTALSAMYTHFVTSDAEAARRMAVALRNNTTLTHIDIRLDGAAAWRSVAIRGFLSRNNSWSMERTAARRHRS